MKHARQQKFRRDELEFTLHSFKIVFVFKICLD